MFFLLHRVCLQSLLGFYSGGQWHYAWPSLTLPQTGVKAKWWGKGWDWDWAFNLRSIFGNLVFVCEDAAVWRRQHKRLRLLWLDLMPADLNISNVLTGSRSSGRGNRRHQLTGTSSHVDRWQLSHRNKKNKQKNKKTTTCLLVCGELFMNSCSLFSNIPDASLSHIIKAVLVIIMPVFVFVEIVVMIFLGPPPTPTPRPRSWTWLYCCFCWVESWLLNLVQSRFCFQQLWIFTELVHFGYVCACVYVCVTVLCCSWCVVVRVTLRYFSL